MPAEPIDAKTGRELLAPLLKRETWPVDMRDMEFSTAAIWFLGNGERLLDAAAALEAIEKERAEAMTVLAPNMPESGLVDACRQVKQAAVTWKGNCEAIEKERDALLGLLHVLYPETGQSELDMLRELWPDNGEAADRRIWPVRGQPTMRQARECFTALAAREGR